MEISELLVLLPLFTGNNLHGTQLGSRKKPNTGRSPACRLWMADAHSHIPCRSHAELCRGLEKSISEGHGRGMAWEQHGRGMACVNQTWPHYVKQMGKTKSTPLAGWHSRGTAWYVWISLNGIALPFTHLHHPSSLPGVLYTALPHIIPLQGLLGISILYTATWPVQYYIYHPSYISLLQGWLGV
jgi:hypothetical protein